MVWSHQPFVNNYYSSVLHPSRIFDFRKFIPRSRSGAPEPQYSGWATRVTLGIKVTNSKPALCCDQGLLPALRAIGPVVGKDPRYWEGKPPRKFGGSLRFIRTEVAKFGPDLYGFATAPGLRPDQYTDFGGGCSTTIYTPTGHFRTATGKFRAPAGSCGADLRLRIRTT